MVLRAWLYYRGTERPALSSHSPGSTPYGKKSTVNAGRNLKRHAVPLLPTHQKSFPLLSIPFGVEMQGKPEGQPRIYF